MTSKDGDRYWSEKISCPKCQATMEQFKQDLFELDRCPSCQGLWFDARELDLLRVSKAADSIDTGSPAVGQFMNSKDGYDCPRCGGNMLRLVDPGQPHIWYETCSSCRGSFMDAGEFSDLTEYSVSDLFKRLSTPERR